MQLVQMIGGIFWQFYIRRDNLVADENFINQLSFKLKENISLTETLRFIYNEHIINKYYFIFVNILPSIFGLYFILQENLRTHLFFILIWYQSFLF